MVREMITRRDDAQIATDLVVHQGEKHLANELVRNPSRGEGGGRIGHENVVGVEVGVDTLNAAHETTDGGSGDGTPPLIGNFTASECNHVSIGPVVGDLFYICVENHDCTFNRTDDLWVVFEFK